MTKPKDVMFFNGDWRARSDQARALVREVKELLEQVETRKRKRKPADQDIYDLQIEALVCELLRLHLLSPKTWLAVPFSNRVLGRTGRYSSPALKKSLRDRVNQLASMKPGLVTIRKGGIKLEVGEESWCHTAERTKVRPTKKLTCIFDKYDLSIEDLEQIGRQETIVLKAPKRGKAKELQDYADNSDTERYRRELEVINDWIGQADIHVTDHSIDAQSRRLYRVFNNGSFVQGGRFYGGFWIEMDHEQRLHNISINYEWPVEIDFGQMSLTLLYASIGKEPPMGDLYCIPGFECYREGMKKTIISCLYADEVPTRKFNGTGNLFDKKTSIKDILEAISKHHKHVWEYFFSGVGMNMMFKEAELLVSSLLRLKKLGVVALPIHDAVLLPASKTDLGKAVLTETCKEMYGFKPSLSITQ